LPHPVNTFNSPQHNINPVISGFNQLRMSGFPSPSESPYRFSQPLPNFSAWPQPPANWIDNNIKQPQK